MAVHKLRGLEYLVAVIDHGGFNAAARQLGVAAPSVHRLVKALEAELGVALVDRSARPVKATPGAIDYVARAKALLSELNELDAGLRDQTRTPRGRIGIAVHSVVLEFVLPRWLPAFHARYPDITLDIVEAGAVRDLARLGTDMLLQFGWPPPQEAVLRTLAQTRWLIVATPAFWDRHGIPRHPADLARMPCAVFRTPFGEVLRQWVFEREGERVTVDVDGWLVSDSRNALDAPLYEGQLAARVNDLTAHPGIADGRLQAVLLDWAGVSSPPLSLIVRRSLVRQPRMRAWIDFAADQANRMTMVRLPAGLPAVRPAERPAWWKKRVSVPRRETVRR